MQPNFQHNLIWKYCVIFGTLFNDIVIYRSKDTDKEVQKFKVPIEFAPAEKNLAIINRRDDDNRTHAIQLPRMSYEMTGISYDSTRKSERRHDLGINNKLVRRIPYNINFQLNVLAKNLLDATAIIEQVVFMFQPDFTVDVKLLDDVNHSDRISIDQVSVSSQDEFEGDFETLRRTQWTLDFVLHGWFYGPVSDGKQIKLINIDINPSLERINGDKQTIEMETIVGLTPWGTPAPSKIDSIDYKLIKSTDNYSILQETKENI